MWQDIWCDMTLTRKDIWRDSTIDVTWHLLILTTYYFLFCICFSLKIMSAYSSFTHPLYTVLHLTRPIPSNFEHTTNPNKKGSHFLICSTMAATSSHWERHTYAASHKGSLLFYLYFERDSQLPSAPSSLKWRVPVAPPALSYCPPDLTSGGSGWPLMTISVWIER